MAVWGSESWNSFRPMQAPLPSRAIGVRSALQFVVCAVVLLAQSACFPAMLHGPRVEPGLSGTVNISQVAGPTHTEGDYGGLHLRNASVGLGVGYGWRAATAHRPSFFAGAYVPVVFPFAQLDLFAQAPEAWTGPTSGGLGVNAAIDHVAPYLQWGVVSAAGFGWSTTQGLNVRYGGGEENGKVSWTPGVAAHLGVGRHRVHLFAMGAFGQMRRICVDANFRQGGCAGERSHAVLGGVAFEFRLRRATDRPRE
jgi:hypothetical protein